MLYFCIPVHNEAPTIGVLLWRLRKVLQEFSREYEVLVYDDASTDGTAETLAPYERVLPLTVLRGHDRVGYARALEELLRTASRRTRYPRRDAIVTLQGDFSDQPEHIPELIRRFEGGADVVVAERPLSDDMPPAVRRLRRAAPWVLRPFASVPGVADPFSTFRLYRVSVIRDLMRESWTAGPRTDGWAANAAILVRLARHARRIETLALEPRYDLRLRESRVRPWADAIAILHTGRELRSGRSRYAALTAVEPPEARGGDAPPQEPRPATRPGAKVTVDEETRERARRSRRGGGRGARAGRGDGNQPKPTEAAREPAPQNGSRPPKPSAETEPGAPTLAAPGGSPAQQPPGEAQRPRRRRGGRSRRRARSGDEGPGTS